MTRTSCTLLHKENQKFYCYRFDFFISDLSNGNIVKGHQRSEHIIYYQSNGIY